MTAPPSDLRHPNYLRVEADISNANTQGKSPLLGRALSRGLVLLGMPLLPKRSVRGFEVFTLDAAADLDDFTTKVARALDLISAVDPKRLVQLKRYVRRFGLVAAGGDYFLPAARAHVVSRDWLDASNETQLALNMLHESVHARLHHIGLRPARAEDERVERLCLSLEATFARRLANGEELARRLEARLMRPWWTPDVQATRLKDRLSAVGLPRWLTDLIVRWRFGPSGR